jgi:IclR family pca regulon transcriptional regulator
VPRTTEGPTEPAPTTGVQSLERGLAVIRSFDADHDRMTLSDVARRTGLTRATARRFLHTLVQLDYMQTDGRNFWLRPRILDLGYAYLSSLSLPDIAAPHLKELSEEIHESSSISVLDGTDVVYVARIPARRIMSVRITVGTRFPAYVTSMGRAILAGLPREEVVEILGRSDLEQLTPHTLTDPDELMAAIEDVRRLGYALVDQELEVGLRSIAVPITDTGGRVVAAVNVSVPATAVSIEHVRTSLLPSLQATRDAIQADLRSRYAVHGG